MFSWNHFWWDKVKTHVSIYWYKLGKKHWKMMTFWRYVIANSSKNIEKSGLLKNMRQDIICNSSKSIDPYKTKLWKYWTVRRFYQAQLANFDQFSSRKFERNFLNLYRYSEAHETQIPRFFFFKDPYWCAHFRRSFFERSLWIWPFRGRFFVRSWVAVYSLTVLGLAVYSLMMAIFMSSGLQFLPLPFDSWLEHVSFS